MSVHIPFKVDDMEFSPRELKLKEAETLKTIQEINDNKALTLLKGYEYSREYLRSLIRRGSSSVSFIKDYVTADGYKVRLYFIG